MRLPPPVPRPRREGTVAMINVAFLLLVFFLLVARIAPPDPFDVTLPVSEAGEPADLGDVLVLAADGRMGYARARGPAIWDRIAARDETGPLLVRADAALGGPALAALTGRLVTAGVTRITLLAEGR